MRQFLESPKPRFGREPTIEISELLELKALAERWKRQTSMFRGRLSDKVFHNDVTKKPKLGLIEQTSHLHAVLLPIVGSKNFTFTNSRFKKLLF